MKKATLIIGLLLCMGKAFAGNPVYLLDKFTTANMFFQNGTYATAKVNYELTTGQIQYLQDGELMEIPEENGITRIELVGGRTFYQRAPRKFFEKIQRENGSVLVNWKLLEVNMGSVGAYGTVTQSKVVAVRVPTQQAGVNLLNDPEHPIYERDVYKKKSDNTYMFTINGKEYKVKTLKNLYKAFSSKQKELKEYIAEKKLSFNFADEALQIIDYLFTLK